MKQQVPSPKPMQSALAAAQTAAGPLRGGRQCDGRAGWRGAALPCPDLRFDRLTVLPADTPVRPVGPVNPALQRLPIAPIHQRQALPLLQRAPDDGPSQTSSVNDDIFVDLYITTETGIGGSGYTESGGVVDLSDQALYEGDLFMLSAGYDDLSRSREKPPIAQWLLPPEIEKVQDLSPQQVQLRVASGSKASVVGQDVDVTLVREGSDRQVVVHLKIAPLPAQPSAVNPELAQNEAERSKLRRERRQSRQEFREKQREARRELRSLDPQERREGRAQFRQERAERRSARKEERGRLREEAQELRQERRALNRADSCGLDNERTIDRALSRAVQVVNAAVGRLQGAGPEDPAVNSALSRYLKWTRAGSTGSPTDSPTQRAVDILIFARNSMLTADHTAFQCGSTSCDENTGAFVQSGSGRGDTVTVCHSWVRASISFTVTRNAEEAQAYALLHEFVHLAGPQAADETYVHKHEEWKALTHEQAMGMADAYAALAWTLAS